MTTNSNSPTTTTTPRQQRLFSDEEELLLLKSFFTLAKSSDNINIDKISSKQQFDTPLRAKFTDNQLTDKLRRLRKKYHGFARTKAKIRTPHDRQLFEISKRIWGKTGNSPDQGGELNDVGMNGQDELNDVGMNGQDGLRVDVGMNGEDGLRVGVGMNGELGGRRNVRKRNEEEDDEVNVEKKYPFLLKEFSRCLPENPVWREGFNRVSEEKLRDWNDKWKKLQIEEAKIMAKRAEMLQQQMKVLLEFA